MKIDNDQLVLVNTRYRTYESSGGLNVRIPAEIIEALGVTAKQQVRWYRDTATNDVVVRFEKEEI